MRATLATRLVLLLLLFVAAPGSSKPLEKADRLRVYDLSDRTGFVDREGKLVIPYQFRSAVAFEDGTAFATKSGSGLVDRDGKTVVPFRWGWVRKSGDLVLAKGGPFETRPAFGALYSGGKEIFAGEIPSNEISEGFVVVRSATDSLYGLASKNGVAVTPAYLDLKDVSEGLAAFQDVKTKLWGFIDTTGKVVIPPTWIDTTGAFREGLVGVKISSKWGFADKTGKLVIPATFDEARGFGEGLAPVRVTVPNDVLPKWGFIDRKGAMKIEPTFDDAFPFEKSGFATVKGKSPSGRWGHGLLDKKGKLLGGETWSNVPRDLAGGMRVVTANIASKNQQGAIDVKTGELKVPTKYHELTDFDESGAAAFASAGSYGVWQIVSRDGKELGAPVNTRMTKPAFVAGYVAAEDPATKKWGILDTKGAWVVPAKYENMFQPVVTSFGILVTAKKADGTWTAVDTKGKESFPGISTIEAHGDMTWTQNREKASWVDPKGKVIWSSTFPASKLGRTGVFLEANGFAKETPPAEIESKLTPLAEAGDGVAAFLLARAIASGKVPGGKEAAAKWLQKAAEAGDFDAAGRWGEALLYGRGGVAKDVKKGEEYLRIAAEAGDDGWASITLAHAYMDGTLGSNDIDKALPLFRDTIALAQMKNPMEHSDAKHMVGTILARGMTKKKEDVIAGRAMLLEIAERPAARVPKALSWVVEGAVLSYFDLGYSYETGGDFKELVDLQKAKQYFREAGNAGHKDSAQRLADIEAWEAKQPKPAASPAP